MPNAQGCSVNTRKNQARKGARSTRVDNLLPLISRKTMERLGRRLAGCLLARLSSSNLGCHRPAIKFDDFNSTHKLNISLPSKFRRKNSTIKYDGLNSTYQTGHRQLARSLWHQCWHFWLCRAICFSNQTICVF